MCNIPYVIKSVWSKSIAERHGLLQHWTVNIFTSISLSLFMVSLINCFKVWYLILTLGWGVGEGGWPCFAERLSWLARSYKQLVFMASLANVIFYCFPVAQGVSKMGFWFVFCFLCERVPRCRPDQPLQFALWVPTMLGSYWKPSTLLFAYFWFDFYFILGFFFGLFGFLFFQPGWEDTKPREQNGHTRPFCANAAVPGSRGRFCPSPRRLKILLDTQGPDFPLRSPPCPWHVSAPTQRLKVVSAFKAETLLFSGFLLPPPPFHSVLLNEPEQLLKASEPFQLLSEVGSF